MEHQHKFESDSFFERVYEVVKLIPFGRVTSYGAIANYLGSELRQEWYGKYR